MSLKIIWFENAINFLEKLDEHLAERITKKIDEIKLNPEKYIFSLVNKNYSKIRVGVYRLFVNYSEEKNELVIRSIKHRKNAYKK